MAPDFKTFLPTMCLRSMLDAFCFCGDGGKEFAVEIQTQDAIHNSPWKARWRRDWNRDSRRWRLSTGPGLGQSWRAVPEICHLPGACGRRCGQRVGIVPPRRQQAGNLLHLLFGRVVWIGDQRLAPRHLFRTHIRRMGQGLVEPLTLIEERQRMTRSACGRSAGVSDALGPDRQIVSFNFHKLVKF